MRQSETNLPTQQDYQLDQEVLMDVPDECPDFLFTYQNDQMY